MHQGRCRLGVAIQLPFRTAAWRPPDSDGATDNSFGLKRAADLEALDGNPSEISGCGFFRWPGPNLQVLQTNSCRQKHVRRDRQVPYPSSGGVKDRIGHGCPRSGDSNFPNPFGSQWVDMGVLFVHTEGIHIAHVCVRGDVIPGQVVVHPAAQLLVHHGVLVKSQADSPPHAADQLAPCCLRIQDPAAKQPIIRETRTCPKSASTRTSAN